MQRKRMAVGGSLLAAIAVAGGTLAFENNAFASHAKPAAVHVAAKPVAAAKPAAKPVAVADTAATKAAKAKAKALAERKAMLIKAGKGQAVEAAASPVPMTQDEKDEIAFLNAGYDWNDATKLAALWHTDTVSAKAEGGRKLEAGETLPIPPSGEAAPADDPQADKYVNDFFNAGYTYDDAVKLGKMWNEDSYHAKIDGGKKIDAGEKLPVGP